MSIFNSALFVINETYADEYVKRHMTPLKVTQALSDAGLLAPESHIIRTVEELEALDPYDVIAYKSPEGYGLVCTAYDATIGDADYALPVVTVCSNSTTMSALRALNKEKE